MTSAHAPRPSLPARAPAASMVLLAGPGPEGGGARRVSPQTPSPPRDAPAGEDPADYEEYEDFSCLPDTRSIASDDSFYPVGGEEEYGTASAESVPEGVPEEATLLRAACANDVGLLRALVRRGPSAEEVQETDRNGRVSWRPSRVRIPSALPPIPRHPDPGSVQSRGDCAAAQSASWSLSGRAASVEPGVAVWAAAGLGGCGALPEVTAPRETPLVSSPHRLPLVSRPRSPPVLEFPPPPPPGARARIGLGNPSSVSSIWAPSDRYPSLPAGTTSCPEPQLPPLPLAPGPSRCPCPFSSTPEHGRAPPGPRESDFPSGSPAPFPQPPAPRRLVTRVAPGQRGLRLSRPHGHCREPGWAGVPGAGPGRAAEAQTPTRSGRRGWGAEGGTRYPLVMSGLGDSGQHFEKERKSWLLKT